MVNNEEHWKELYEANPDYQGHDAWTGKKFNWEDYSEYGKEYKVTLMRYNEENKRANPQ